MRTCSKCNISQHISNFYFRKDTGKYRKDCKSCKNKTRSKYYYNNLEKQKKRLSIYRVFTRDEANRRTREWEQNNRARRNAHTSKRRAAKLNATLKGYDKEIERFYVLAKHFTEVTGIKHEVDHIEPLQGKNSCGLHAPWNLQILTKSENCRKGNRL